MALSTDTSTNFSSATGYTIYENTGGDVVFSAGQASLLAGAARSGAIRTPSVATTSWAAINGASLSLTEAVNFKIKVFFTFSDWSSTGRKTYSRYTQGGEWQDVATDLLSTVDLITLVTGAGMGVAEAEAVRAFPPGTERIAMLVGLQRTDSSAAGGIDLITYLYGTEDVSVSAEPAASGTLTFQPEFPHVCTYVQGGLSVVDFQEGYQQTNEQGAGLRRLYNGLEWSLDETDAATVKSFLDSHTETPFNWQPYGEASSRKWIVTGRTGYTENAVGGYTVTANLQESL